MAYKKYIKIKGKRYGPYFYESYREDGKVKKKYIGDEEEYKKLSKKKSKISSLKSGVKNKTKPFFIFLIIALIVLGGFLFFYNNFSDNYFLNSENQNQKSELGSLNPLSDEIEIIEENFSEEIISFEPIIENLDINNSEKPIIETKRYNAIINRPVKWVQTIEVNNNTNLENFTIEVPKYSQEITIKTDEESKKTIQEIEDYNDQIESLDKKELMDNEGSLASTRNTFILRSWNFLKDFKIKLTGDVILEEWEISEGINETHNASIINLGDVVELNQDIKNKLEIEDTTEISVEYYTEGPKSFEKEVSNGKEIIISADDEFNYTDILAYTELNNSISMNDINKIKLYWIVNINQSNKDLINQEEILIENTTIPEEIPEINETEVPEVNITDETNITEEQNNTEIILNETEIPEINETEVPEVNITGEENNTEENIDVNITEETTDEEENDTNIDEIILEEEILSEEQNLTEELSALNPFTRIINFFKINWLKKIFKFDIVQGVIALDDSIYFNSSYNKLSVDFQAYDTDNDGNVDYIEWIVPHLSEQIYELVISPGNVYVDPENAAVDGDYAHLKLSKEKGTFEYFNNIVVGNYLTTDVDAGNVTEKTFSAWIKPSKFHDQRAILLDSDRWDYYNWSGLHLYYDRIRIGQSFDQSGLSKYHTGVYSRTRVPLNEWTFVAGTISNQGRMKVFINGKVDEAIDCSKLWSSTDCYNLIYRNFYNPGPSTYNPDGNLRMFDSDTYTFLGGLDDVRFYDRELSENEIMDLYNSGHEFVANPDIAIDPNLKGWWSFDEGNGRTVKNLVTGFTSDFQNNKNPPLYTDPKWLFEFNADNLVNYFSFDADVGGKIAYEFSDYGNNGKYIGFIDSSFTGGNGEEYGACLQASGVGNYVIIQNKSYLNDLTSFSYSSWIRLGDSPNPENNHTILSKGKENGNWMGIVQDNADSYLVGIVALDTGNLEISVPYSGGARWKNAIMTCNFDGTNTNLSLYLNGELLGSIIQLGSPLSNSRYNLTIGGDGFEGFYGNIDEIMIFNNSLNYAEINSIFNEDFKRFKDSGVLELKNQRIIPGEETVNIEFDNFIKPPETSLDIGVKEWEEEKGYFENDLGEDAYLKFDGLSSASLNQNIILNIGDSISFWAYVDQWNMGTREWKNEWDYSGIFRDPSSGNTRNLISLRYENILIYDTISTNSISLFIPEKKWVFLTLVFDNLGTHLYRDEEYIGSTNALGDEMRLNVFGAGYYNKMFNGSIDEVMTFNKTLSAEEVSGLYGLGRENLYGSYLDNLRITHWYNFDNSQPKDVIEGNDLTLNTGVEIISKYHELKNYYHADNSIDSLSENNILWKDFSENNMPGTYNEGVFNNGFDLNGEKYVVIPDQDYYTLSNFSVGLWMKPQLLDQNQTIITKTDGSYSYYRVALGLDNKLRLFYGFKEVYSIESLKEIQLDKWYYVSFVWDNQNMKFYLDGDLQGSLTETPSENGVDILIGVKNNSGSGDFEGLIDEVMIFNRALNEREIAELNVKARANWLNTDYIPLTSDNNIRISPYIKNILPSVLFNSESQFFTPILFLNDSAKKNITISDAESPLLEFVPPTPIDDQVVGANQVNIKISSIDAYQHMLFVDFNHTTLAWMRFDDFNSTDYLSKIGKISALKSGNIVEGKFGNALNLSNAEFIKINGLMTLGLSQSMWIKPLNGEWTYIFNNSGIIYVNGELGSGELPLRFSDGLYVGENFEGEIDELIIFNRILGLNEIKSLYDSKINQYDNLFLDLLTSDYYLNAYSQDLVVNLDNISVSFAVNPKFPNVKFVPPTEGVYADGNNLAINVSIIDESKTFSFIDFEDSILAWWDMDKVLVDEFGNRYVPDYTGVNNCTIVKFNPTPTIFGAFGNAMEFSTIGSSNSYLDCGNDQSLAFEDKVTVSFWMKPKQLVNTPWAGFPIFHSGGYSTGSGDTLRSHYPSNIRVYFYGDSFGDNNNQGILRFYAGPTDNTTYVSGGYPHQHRQVSPTYVIPNINQWYHVVWTYDRDDYYGGRIYIDGNQIGTGARTYGMRLEGNTYGQSLKIGYQVYNNTMDEIIILDRVLNSNEIKALYNSQVNKLDVQITGLDADETYDYKAYVKNTIGNLNVTESRQTLLDDNSPSITINYPGIDQVVSSNFEFEVKLEDNYDARAGCNYSLDNSEFLPMNLDSIAVPNSVVIYKKSHVFLANDTLAHGKHNLRVLCSDVAGNFAFKDVNFSADIFHLLFNLNVPAQVNTLDLINLNGLVQRNNYSNSWPLEDNLYSIKINNKLVSSDEYVSDFNGVGENIEVNGNIKLNSVAGTSSNTIDQYNTNPIGRDNYLSSSNLGYFSGRIFYFYGGTADLGYIIYNYTSATAFSDASAYVITSDSGVGNNNGIISIEYRFPGQEWNLLNSQSGIGRFGNQIPGINGKKEFNIRLAYNYTGAKYNAIDSYEINYANNQYVSDGNFISNEIYFPNISYTFLKWNEELNGGDIKVQLRENALRTINLGVISYCDHPSTNTQIYSDVDLVGSNSNQVPISGSLEGYYACISGTDCGNSRYSISAVRNSPDALTILEYLDCASINGKTVYVLKDDWQDWSQNYTNSLGETILNLFNENHLQYRVWLERNLTNFYSTPILNNLSVLYFNGSTDDLGNFNKEILVPSSDLGRLPIELSISNTPFGVNGSTSKLIDIYAETQIEYDSWLDYSGVESKYFVDVNFSRIDGSGFGEGNIYIKVGSQTKSCLNQGICKISFEIPSELFHGAYNIIINGTNPVGGYYQNSSAKFTTYLEEKTTKSDNGLNARDIEILNYDYTLIYPLVFNASVTNYGNASMHGVQVFGPSELPNQILSVMEAENSCNIIAPNQTCNITMSVVIKSQVNGEFDLNLFANWTNNDGSISEGSSGREYIEDSMHIIIFSQAVLKLSELNHTETIQHGQNKSFNLGVISAGTEPLTQVDIFVNQSLGNLNPDWVELNPSVLSGFSTLITQKDLEINISIPLQTSPGTYWRIINFESDGGNLEFNLSVNIPINKSWIFLPNQNYSHSNIFGLNDPGFIGNWSIINLGNVDIDFGIIYLSVLGYGDQLFNLLFNVNKIVDNHLVNPNILNVKKGEISYLEAYQNGRNTAFNEIRWGIRISNSSAYPNVVSFEENFSIAEQDPRINDILFYYDSPVYYIEQNKPLRVKFVTEDDKDLSHLVANFSNIYLGTVSYDGIENLSEGISEAGELRAMNYTINFVPNYPEKYIINATIYDKNGRENSSGITFTPIGRTEINLSLTDQNNRLIEIYNVNSLEDIVLEDIGFELTNLENVSAYDVSLIFESTSPIDINSISLGNFSSNERKVSLVDLTIPKLISPGGYSINASVMWTNPNNNPDSSDKMNIVVNVFENKEIFTQDILMGCFAGQINSYKILINNTGNVPISEINLELTGEEILDKFIVEFNQTDIYIPAGRSKEVLMNLTPIEVVMTGDYFGKINISAPEVSREIEIIASVFDTYTWQVQPTNLSITKGYGQTGKLGSLFVKNTGNKLMTFNISSEDENIIWIDGDNEVSLLGGAVSSFNLSFLAPDVEGNYLVNMNLESDSQSHPSKIVPIDLEVTKMKVNVISPNELFNYQNLVEGDAIEVWTNATYQEEALISGLNWSIYVDVGEWVECNNTSFSFNGNSWIINCNVPGIESGMDGQVYDLIAKVNHTLRGIVSGIAEDTLHYLDVTNPIFRSIYKNDIQNGSNINLLVDAYDNVGIEKIDVEITYPDEITTLPCEMTNLVEDTWNCSSYVLDISGEYLVNYTAYDFAGNNLSKLGWFEVYDKFLWKLKLFDYLNNPTLEVNFSLLRPLTNELLVSNSTDDNGEISLQVNSRIYDVLLKTSNEQVLIKNVNFADFSNLPNLNIYRYSGELNEIIPLHKHLQGLIFNSSQLENNSIEITFEYFGENLTYDYDEANRLEIMKCSNWSYFTRVCLSSWEILTSERDIDNKTVFANSTGFSAYFLTENKCGDGVCDISYGESISTCSLDCKEGGSGTIDIPDISSGGGGGGGSSSFNKEEFEQLLKSIINVAGIKLETTSIYKELFEGEVATVRVKLANTLGSPTTMDLSVEGEARQFVFFEEDQVSLAKDEVRDVLIRINIPEEMTPGTYEGDLVLTSKGESGRIPITIRVLSPEGKLLDVKIQSLNSKISPGGNVKLQTDLINIGKADKVDVQFDLQLINVDTGEILNRLEEAFAIETSLSTIKELKIPDDTVPGKYMIKATAYYSNLDQDMQASSITYVEVRIPFFKRNLFSIPLWSYLAFILLVFFGVGFYYYRKWNEFRKKRFKVKVELNKLPKKGANSAYVGKVAEVGDDAFMDMDSLKTHTLIAGATGSGKTVAAQGIIEEALLKKKSVIIFDPTAQWTGFLRKNQDSKMFKRYKYFGMKNKDAKAFSGSIKTIHDPYEIIDIKKYMDRPGEITIINLVHLTPSEIDLVVASSIEQIFRSAPEEQTELKNLFVYDEVHRLLPKFGGSGKGFIQIERGAREFRKWGMGLLLISQVVSDFVGEIKANIGTEVQLRTRYEGDLERVNMKYGDSVLKSVVKEPVGTGMVVNAEYNEGRPYFIAFRPLLHNTKRLSTEELTKYEKYFDEVEDIEYQISELKKLKVDVMGLELELKLAKSRVSEGQFSMAEMYFEGLRPKLVEEWKKLKKSPKHLEKQKISKAEVMKGISEAKREREKYLKKNPQETVSLKEEFLKIKSKIDEKKKKGKTTSNVEIKLQDLQNQTKKYINKPLPADEVGWIKKEIKDLYGDIESL